MFYVSIQYGAGYHYFVFKSEDKSLAVSRAMATGQSLSKTWHGRGARPVVRVLEEVTTVGVTKQPKGT